MNKKKLWIYFLTALLTIGWTLMYAQPAYAGNATVSVSASASQVTTGTTVTVTVGISADEEIGYGVAIAYDPSILEYQGGGDGGGSGTVTLVNEGPVTSTSRTLTFTAVGTGTSAISASEYAGGCYGYVTGDMSVSYGGASVTVSAPQASPGESGGNDGGGDAPDTTAPLVGSGDNLLKSLDISPGTLTPAFQPQTTSYSVTLPEDTTSIVVSAVPNDSKAKVAVSHNNDLEPGANKTYIVVTAENGTQRTYVLNITCGEVPEEPEEAAITINGVQYGFATPEQMEGVAIPEGFEAGESEYEQETITVYTSPNHLLQIVYLIDTEGNGQWFLYEKDQKTFQPYVEYQATGNRYVILTPGDDVQIPSGYEATELEIQGQTVTAYVKNGETEFVLLYAVNINGEPGFYLYDTVEGTYQRYVEPDVTEEVLVTTEAATTEAPPVPENEKLQHLRVMLYIISGIAVVLLGLVIGMVVYHKRKVKPIDDIPEDFADLDEKES